MNPNPRIQNQILQFLASAVLASHLAGKRSPCSVANDSVARAPGTVSVVEAPHGASITDTAWCTTAHAH